MDKCRDCGTPIWDRTHADVDAGHPFKFPGTPKEVTVYEPLQLSSTVRLVRDLGILTGLMIALWLLGVIGGVP